MSVVKTVSLKDGQGQKTTYDIGALAQNVVYDNTSSELQSNNIQDAIDELAEGGGGSTTAESVKLASSGTTASGEIRFGVDGQGNYGYIKAGADSVTPFKNPTGNKAIPQITQNGTVTDIDVADYATASLDIAVPVPVHTETYTPAANTAANDMGANHSYRYVNTSGMVIPSGTKNISITSNGTTTESVTNYANASITVNVTDPYLNHITQKWNMPSGLSNFDAQYIWSDGDNIYYSNYDKQYVLDKATFTWTAKIWNGYTNINGSKVWSDGKNYYYSAGSAQYVLNKATSTWSTMTWVGSSFSIDGVYIWKDFYNTIYYSNGGNQYMLYRGTNEWAKKTWSGYTSFNAKKIWSDRDNIYYSDGTTQKILDGSTWSNVTWSGVTSFDGQYIWSDGDNIYYSNYPTTNKILDKSTRTWSDASWGTIANFYGAYVWSDGDVIYHNSASLSKVYYKMQDTWYNKSYK